ncbi:DUF2927 domain-containing protein [Pontimicrobium sp. MEBiC01747]
MRILSKKTFIFILIFFVFFLVLFQCIRKEREEYTPTKYEEKLINYFKLIALQSEYDDNPQRIIKWEQPMVLYIIKDKEYKPQVSVIKKTISHINRLATDGFKIVLTNDYSISNSILFLCNKEHVKKLDEHFYEILSKDIDYEVSGLAYSEFDMKTYVIKKSLIFIDSEYSFESQEATILEEITQSLGLAFDSEKYPNSIFYQKKYEQQNIIKEYSDLDKDIIRLLYHPIMKSGLDSIKVERVIKRILKSEKG